MLGAGGASIIDVDIGVAGTIIVGPELGGTVKVTVIEPVPAPIPAPVSAPVTLTPGVAIGTTGSPAIGTIDNPSKPAGACVAIAADSRLV